MGRSAPIVRRPPPMLTSTIENVLNRGLPRSPRAPQLCAELAGRRLVVAVAPTELGNVAHVLVESTGASLKLSLVKADALAGSPPDATVTGGPFSLLSLSG